LTFPTEPPRRYRLGRTPRRARARRRGLPWLFGLPALGALVLAVFAWWPDDGPGPRQLEDRPLPHGNPGQELATDLRKLLQEREGSIGVILLDPAKGVLLEHEAGQPQVLASVAKLYTLCAFLDFVEQQGRGLTEAEVLALYAMIAGSDNDVAWALWNQIGGIEAVERFLAVRQFPAIAAGRDGSWGSLRASPRDVAALLAELFSGRLFAPPTTEFALGLLANYGESQAWGISAGLGDDPALGVFLKNGWYPEPEGWVVNGAGIIDSDSAPAYVLVVLTNFQPDFEYGVETIEAIASLVNGSVTGSVTGRP
jgi:hypothetical protein